MDMPCQLWNISWQQQDSPESPSQEGTADSGFYQDCSSYPSSQIEDFAKNVKSLFLEKDWDAIAALISYPITIDGIICEDHSDFLSLDLESELNPDFLSAMEAETCQEMFHNWQGISMGAKGELWLVPSWEGLSGLSCCCVPLEASALWSVCGLSEGKPDAGGAAELSSWALPGSGAVCELPAVSVPGRLSFVLSEGLSDSKSE